MVTHGPALVIDGRTIPITKLRTRIGRSSAAFTPDLDLRPFDSWELVSRRQAELVFGGAGIALVDLGSLNGTELNGRDLTPGEPNSLRDGDVVTFVGIQALFRRFAPWPEGLEVEWAETAPPAPAPPPNAPENTVLGRRWQPTAGTL